MAVIEYICPLTGERTRIRFAAGQEAPAQHYAASCTKAQIDEYEKAHPKAQKLARHAHQA